MKTIQITPEIRRHLYILATVTETFGDCPPEDAGFNEKEAAAASLWAEDLSKPEDLSGIKESPCAKGLAIAFSKMIREELIDHMPHVIERNRKYPHNACATQDFCDANMTMEAAFTEFMGRQPVMGEGDDAAEERDCALWNAAWALAKAAEFDPADII